jgi:2'-5' RNA ligase
MEDLLKRTSYLLLIEPEKKVSFRIEKLRDTIHSEVNMIENPFYNPHVTVFEFLQYESFERKFVPAIRDFVSQLHPFTLTLTDFGSFGHTFYLQVKPLPKELSKISACRKELKVMTRATVNTQSIYHLTVFKDLAEQMSEKIWGNWKDKKFEDFFVVKEFVFLRKKDNQRHYQEVARFPLLGKEIVKPVYVQGRLFD